MSLDQEQLREGLRELADAAPDVDVRGGVRQKVRRRRRRQTVGTALVAVVLAGAGLASKQWPQAEPAGQRPGAGVQVDLAALRTGTMPAARLVVSVSGGGTYAVAAGGRAVKLPLLNGAGPSTEWRLSPDGSRLAGMLGAGSANPVVVLQRTDGRRTLVPLPHDRRIDGVAVTPDGRRLAVFATMGSFDLPGTLRMVQVPGGRVDAMGSFVGGPVEATWSSDGMRLVMARSALPDRVVETAMLTVAPHVSVLPAAAYGAVGVDAAVEQGWVASPDGRWLLMGVRAAAGPVEDWYQLDAASGVLYSTLLRPTGDTPLAWTSDGHIVWWRLPVGGSRAQVIESDLDGKGDHVLYNVTVPTDRVVYAWYAAN